MDEKRKLYDVLVRDGYFTKSYEEFNSKWNDASYRDKVYGVVSRDGLYTKSKDEFMNKYGVDVKKKDQPQTTSTGGGVVQTPPQPSQPSLTASEVWSQASSQAPQATAPTPTDVASESAGLDVQSPSGVPSPNVNQQVNIPVPEVAGIMPTGQTATSIIQESTKKPKPSFILSDYSSVEIPENQLMVDEFGKPIDESLRGQEIYEEQQKKLIDWQESGGHKMIQNKYNQIEEYIKNNYTPEQILAGEHEDVANKEMDKFLEQEKDNIPLALYTEYMIDKGNLIKSIKDSQAKNIKRERVVKNIDNEAFKIENLDTEGFESMREDYEKGEVSNSEILWNDFLWKNNPDKAIELYKDLTGEEFTTGNENQDAWLMYNPQEKARLAVEEMRGFNLDKKVNDLNRKIYDVAISTGNNEEEYYKIADAYKSDMVKNNIGWQPLSDKWDATKEYYRLFQKEDKSDSERAEMKKLSEVINQPNNAFYDVETGKWTTDKNEISRLRSQSFNSIKDEIRSTYGQDAIGSLMRDIEKTASEIEYLKPIRDRQMSSTKLVSQDMPGQTVTQEVSYDQFSTPEVQNKIKDLSARLNAMVEVLIDNTNPSDNPEKNFFDALFNTSDVKIQEHKRDLIRASNQVGNPLSEQDIDYLEDDFNAKLGNTIRESAPLGAEIMFDILVGGKVKGILGVGKLVDKLNKGNKFKKFLSKTIDKGYDILNQEVAFQSAGEGVGAGTGEYLVENIAEKIMPKGWNKFTRAGGRILAGTVGETGAEYGGQIASNYIEDGDFNKAVSDAFEGEGEQFLLTLASSFIMTAPTAGLRGSDGENISKEVNTGNILLTKKRLDDTGESSEMKDDFDRTVEEYYPEEVIKAQGKKLFTDGNIESYSDIVEKPVNEWTDDEVTFVNGMDGFYESSKELLPEKQRGEFERLKDRFDKREKVETKTKEDAVQEQSTESVDVREQPADGEGVGVEPKKLKVYRGVGNNISEGSNEGFNWVAKDKSVATNYASMDSEGNFNVEESEIEEPKNPLKLPYKTNVDVRARNIGENLRTVVKEKMDNGTIDSDNVGEILDKISEWEDIAGDKLEKYHTKINKKGSSKLFSEILTDLGYDSILIQEENSKGELTDTYGIIKKPEVVTEPQDGDTISQPARFEGGLEKNYRYNAENGTWNEIDSQGNELGGEISPTLSEKLTQDFINQKQEQYESKRVDADKASYGSSKQTVPSEERLRMEQKDDKTVGDEQATEPSGRGVTSQEQENVTGESVTKETEGQELKSPPPAKETGESSVEEKKRKPIRKVIIPTKIARRIAEGDLNEEKVMDLAEKAASQQESFKENSKVADSLINEMGIDDAYAFVNSPDMKVNARVKSDVVTAKYVDLRNKSTDKKYSRLKQEQFEKEANELLFEISASVKDVARSLAYENELQKKYGLKGSEIDVVRKVKTEIEEKLKEKGVEGKTRQEQIDELRDSVVPVIKQALGGNATNILKENEELKSKVKELLEKIAKTKVTKAQKKIILEREIKDAKSKLKNALKGKSGKAYSNVIPGVSYATNVIEAFGELVVAYAKSGLYNTNQIINKVRKDAKEIGENVSAEDMRKIAMAFDEFKTLNNQEQAIIQKEVVRKVLGRKFDPRKSIEENIEGKNIVGLWEKYQNETIENVKNAIKQLKKKANKQDKAFLDSLSQHIEKNIKEKIKEVVPRAKSSGGKKLSKINILSNLIENQIDINNTFNKILDSLDDGNVKNYLENRLSDEILISNETLRGATEEFLKKELTSENLFNIISDASSKGQSYTQALRDRLIDQMNLSKAEANEITSLIGDYIDLNYNESIMNKIDKFLGEKIKSKVNLKDLMPLAENYFINPEITTSSLSDLIMADENINVSSREAKLISDKISSEVSSFIESKLDTELNKFFKPKKELSETEKALEKEQRREKNKLISRVQKAIVLGKVNSASFRNAFAEHFGFKEIEPEVMGAIASLYSDALKFRNEGKTEMFRRTQTKINSLLESISDKSKRKRVAETIQELDYTNILSGLNTQANAAWGGTLGALINGTAFTLRNMIRPGSIAYGFKKAISKANVNSAISETMMAGKYNFTKHDMGDWSKLTSNNANKETELQRRALEGVFKYIKRNYKKDSTMSEKTKVVMRALGNVFIQHTRMTFLLKAQDAFLRGFISEYVAAVKTYNDTVKDGNYKPLESIFGRNKKLQNTMDKALGYDNYSEYKIQAEKELTESYNEIVSEVDSDIRKGVISKESRNKEIDNRASDLFGKSTFRAWKGKATTGKSTEAYNGYINRRAKELMDNQRTEEINNFSHKVASEWILMNEPETGWGMIYTDTIKKASYIKDGDDLATTLGKLAVTNFFKFPRMTGNTLNIFIAGIPVIGVFPTMYGWYKDPSTGKRKIGRKSKANQEYVNQLLMVNMMTSVAAGLVFKEMFDWDDDEGEFKLDPNRLVDFTSAGYRDWAKNEQSHPDYQNFAVRFRTSSDGDWSKWMKMQYAPHMMGYTAFLGRMVDDSKGMRKESKLNDIEERNNWSIGAVKDYYVSSLESLMEGSFNSVGRSVKPYTYHPTEDWAAVAFEQFIASPVKRMSEPSLYRDIIREYKTQTGAKVKETRSKSIGRTVLNNFVSDFYFLDELMLDDKVNAFGETIPYSNSISSWGKLEQRKMSKYDKMIHQNAKSYFSMAKVPTKIEKSGVTMEILDEDLRAEMQRAARTRLRELVEPNFDKIEEMSKSSDREVIKQFNKGMSMLTNKAKDQIYAEYYKKYKGTDKIKITRKK